MIAQMDMVTINKTTVRAMVKFFTRRGGGVTKATLQKKFKLDPTSEEDRPKIWRLSQCLAELVYGRWIEQMPATRYRGDTVYTCKPDAA